MHFIVAFLCFFFCIIFLLFIIIFQVTTILGLLFYPFVVFYYCILFQSFFLNIFQYLYWNKNCLFSSNTLYIYFSKKHFKIVFIFIIINWFTLVIKNIFLKVVILIIKRFKFNFNILITTCRIIYTIIFFPSISYLTLCRHFLYFSTTLLFISLVFILR